MSEDHTIIIPPELAAKMQQRIVNTQFKSVSDYATYILNQVLKNVEEQEKQENAAAAPERDQNKVQERLKRLESLGYLD